MKKVNVKVELNISVEADDSVSEDDAVNIALYEVGASFAIDSDLYYSAGTVEIADYQVEDVEVVE